MAKRGAYKPNTPTHEFTFVEDRVIACYNIDGPGDWHPDKYPPCEAKNKQQALRTRQHGILWPTEVIKWAQKHKIMWGEDMWRQDGQRFYDWHGTRDFHTIYGEFTCNHDRYRDKSKCTDRCRKYPQRFQLRAMDLRDHSGHTVRLEIFVTERTPHAPGHPAYGIIQPAIYEWRNNGGFMGVYSRHEALGRDISIKPFLRKSQYATQIDGIWEVHLYPDGQ